MCIYSIYILLEWSFWKNIHQIVWEPYALFLAILSWFLACCIWSACCYVFDLQTALTLGVSQHLSNSLLVPTCPMKTVCPCVFPVDSWYVNKFCCKWSASDHRKDCWSVGHQLELSFKTKFVTIYDWILPVFGRKQSQVFKSARIVWV